MRVHTITVCKPCGAHFGLIPLYRDEKLLRTDCTDTSKIVHHYHSVVRRNTGRTQKIRRDKHTSTWNKNKMADSVFLLLMIIIS